MKKLIPFFLFVLTSTSYTLGQDCYPLDMDDYAEWVSVGKPDSWCFPRQCHGDADGILNGNPKGGFFWVNFEDLTLLMAYWKLPWPPLLDPNQLSVDFDHRKAGSPFTGYWRAGARDACILGVWFRSVVVPPANCLIPPIPMPPDTVGPVLSLQISTAPTPVDFHDLDEISLFPGQTIWIGITNTTPDTLKWYDACMIMTYGLEYGSWTGESWCYSSEPLMGWTYYGTTEDWPEMDVWFAAVSYPGINADEDPEGVSAAVQYQQDGCGDVVIELFDDKEFVVDGLIIHGVAIHVSSPNGGEKLVAGSTYDITWDSDDIVEDVFIEYSTDNGQSWTPIDTVPNTGTYQWLVPEVNSNQCLVRISDVSNPAASDVSDTNFTVFQCTWQNYADLNGDCYVDFDDLALFALQWLKCGNPFDEACD